MKIFLKILLKTEQRGISGQVTPRPAGCPAICEILVDFNSKLMMNSATTSGRNLHPTGPSVKHCAPDRPLTGNFHVCRCSKVNPGPLHLPESDKNRGYHLAIAKLFTVQQNLNSTCNCQ